MVTYKATYTLTSDGGKTTYISKPFKLKEQAKKDLYEELERLEKDDELGNMTYCNVIEEEPSTESRLKVKIIHLEEGRPKKGKKTKLKKLDKLYKKRMKIDEKIEALREEVLPPRKGFTSTRKAPSVDEALHRKTCEEHEDYAHLEVQAMLNHDGKKKPKKS